MTDVWTVSCLAVLCSRAVGEAQVLCAAALRVHQLLVQLAGLRPVVRNLVVHVARQRRRRLAKPNACTKSSMPEADGSTSWKSMS